MSHYAAFARFRAVRSALGFAGALALVGGSLGCTDNELTRLQAQFNIVWDDDRGFNAEVEHLGVMEDSMIHFGDVTTGQALVTEVQVTNAGSKDLDLCGLDLVTLTFEGEGEERELAGEQVETNPELVIGGTTGTIGRGEAVQFEMRYTPLFGEALPEALYLSVKHELNWDCDLVEDGEAGTGEGLYIPIFGTGDGEPVPDIYANPASIEFSEAQIGGAGMQTLNTIVGNSGPGLLNISNVTIDDTTNFSIDGTAIIGAFAMGESADLIVDFHPQVQGNLSATISVSSDDPDEAPLEIPVYGVANPGKVGDPPVAVCGPTIQSAPFQNAQLDGTASYDPNGLTLTYNWTWAPPPGSQSNLNNPTSATPSATVPGESFGLDLAGTYVGELVVTNSQGTSSQPCQQEVIATPNENFRVELFWSKPDDMDLHLLAPGGFFEDNFGGTDCYYANCVGFFSSVDWGTPGVTSDDPSLDLDDINGTGPENTNIVAPANGNDYTIVVHDYQGTVDDNTATNCTVNIYLNGILMQTYNFDISGEDAEYYVAEIDWPSGNISACNGLSGC